MMRQYDLVERVLSYDPSADEALLNRAYVYAMKAHGHQTRASGDPYFSHPLEVAAILTDLKLDDATIVTALLHDVIEDTKATRAEIDDLFGHEIGALVDGLTKIKKLDLVSKKAKQAENFRKLLIAITSDIRVLLVKLADRLHNMRTLEHMKPASRMRISEETLEIYAPLAGRMGMQGVREELEDLAFCWLYPDARTAVKARLGELRTRNAGLVDEIIGALKHKLDEGNIKADVQWREKKPYAIWRKMQNKQISLEQLSDIYAFRVVTDSAPDAYAVLGVIHSTWRAVPGRFKDYISTPKQNNYRSIHTTVVGPRHQRVELQIRTADMHAVAEYGVAAHALYKDGVKIVPASSGQGNGSAGPGADAQIESNPYIWLRRLVETLLEGDNPVEFLEHTKLELFQDQVFCFTPKGRLIALPRGATPIDFAYAVHTDIGNSCAGAHINGRKMPLATTLRNGDEVEILISKRQSSPPATWEAIAVTGKARSAIRRAARTAVRRQYCELGRRLLRLTFEKSDQVFDDDKLADAVSRLPQKTAEDVLAAVGRGEMPAGDVLHAALPHAIIQEEKTISRRPRNRLERVTSDEGWFNLTKVRGLKFLFPGSTSASGPDAAAIDGSGFGCLPIRGLTDDVPVTFDGAGAVPGDRIVGVLMPGEGIRIFQIHSPQLKDFEHQRWMDVTWDIDPDKPERFPARILVTALNEPGSLAQIAHHIAVLDGNIDEVTMVTRGADYTKMLFKVEAWDLTHLTDIITGLREKSAISAVERLFE